MRIELTRNEARVIGCLIEKSKTTPDQYPLSLNALVTACNQKSNRDPVLSLEETTVQDTVDELVKRHLISEKSGFGSRVTKYHHRFFNSELGHFRLSDQELAVICVLLLRGPQTPGELRSRTNRLCKFADVQEVEATLRDLAEYEQGPFVAKLAREPGRRESRYMHLFSDQPETAISPGGSDLVVEPEQTSLDRLDLLERLVHQMQGDLTEIRRQLAALTGSDDNGS